MGSLFAALHIASNALDAYQHAINLTSTNVTNASTPGYARQQVVLDALSFDSSSCVGGGVRYSGTIDSRDQYAERNVQQSMSQEGAASQRVTSYTHLEPILPIDGSSGISTALDAFFQAFSSLATAPNDATARQLALDQAQQVVQSFQHASAVLDQAKQGTQQDLTSQVDRVNALADTIVSINKQFSKNINSLDDPGLNAQMAQSLDQLSQYVDLTVLKQDNGTLMLYAGQSLIVSGNQSLPLRFVAGPGHRLVEDSLGVDVSTTLRSGSLSALLDQEQNVEPSLEASLNQMAQGFATAVNTALQSGVDQSNSAPAQDLFSFDPVAGAAKTLTRNVLLPSELALADPTAPGGNAIAVQVANLRNAALVGGSTLTQFYGNTAAELGQNLSDAKNDQTTAQGLTAQAQSMRNDLQGVSLDQEAINLLQFQRVYDATSQFIKVMNELTQDVMNLLK